MKETDLRLLVARTAQEVCVLRMEAAKSAHKIADLEAALERETAERDRAIASLSSQVAALLERYGDPSRLQADGPSTPTHVKKVDSTATFPTEFEESPGPEEPCAQGTPDDAGGSSPARPQGFPRGDSQAVPSASLPTEETKAAAEEPVSTPVEEVKTAEAQEVTLHDHDEPQSQKEAPTAEDLGALQRPKPPGPSKFEFRIQSEVKLPAEIPPRSPRGGTITYAYTPSPPSIEEAPRGASPAWGLEAALRPHTPPPYRGLPISVIAASSAGPVVRVSDLRSSATPTPASPRTVVPGPSTQVRSVTPILSQWAGSSTPQLQWRHPGPQMSSVMPSRPPQQLPSPTILTRSGPALLSGSTAPTVSMQQPAVSPGGMVMQHAGPVLTSGAVTPMLPGRQAHASSLIMPPRAMPGTGAATPGPALPLGYAYLPPGATTTAVAGPRVPSLSILGANGRSSTPVGSPDALGHQRVPMVTHTAPWAEMQRASRIPWKGAVDSTHGEAAAVQRPPEAAVTPVPSGSSRQEEGVGSNAAPVYRAQERVSLSRLRGRANEDTLSATS